MKFNYLNAIGRFITISSVFAFWYGVIIENNLLVISGLIIMICSCLIDTSEEQEKVKLNEKEHQTLKGEIKKTSV